MKNPNTLLAPNWQYAYGITHPEEMSRAYYFAIFHKTWPGIAGFVPLDGAPGLARRECHYQALALGKPDFDQGPPAVATGTSAEQGYYNKQS